MENSDNKSEDGDKSTPKAYEFKIKTRERSQTSDVVRKSQYFGVLNKVLDEFKSKDDQNKKPGNNNELLKVNKYSLFRKHSAADEKEDQNDYKIRIHSPQQMSEPEKKLAEKDSYPSNMRNTNQATQIKEESKDISIQRERQLEHKNSGATLNREQSERLTSKKDSISHLESNSEDSDSSSVTSIDLEQENPNTNKKSGPYISEQESSQKVNKEDRGEIHNLPVKGLNMDLNKTNNKKERILPPIITNVPWKNKTSEVDNSGGEFAEEKSKVEQDKSVDNNSQAVNRVSSRSRREKMIGRSKRGFNKYKAKYKKQTKNLKVLVRGFKEIKKELTDMHKNMTSVQNRINNFEKIIDSLNNLMAQVMSKVKTPSNKEVKPEQKDSTIDKNSTRGYTDDTASHFPLTSAHLDDQFTSTVYLPQRKTIVFSFQKPTPIFKKTAEEESGIADKAQESQSKDTNKDQEFSLINDENTEQGEDNNKNDDQKTLLVEQDSKPDKLKTFIRRVPKLKIPTSSTGIQYINADMTYAINNDKQNFVDKEPK